MSQIVNCEGIHYNVGEQAITELRASINLSTTTKTLPNTTTSVISYALPTFYSSYFQAHTANKCVK